MKLHTKTKSKITFVILSCLLTINTFGMKKNHEKKSDLQKEAEQQKDTEKYFNRVFPIVMGGTLLTVVAFYAVLWSAISSHPDNTK